MHPSELLAAIAATGHGRMPHQKPLMGGGSRFSGGGAGSSSVPPPLPPPLPPPRTAPRQGPPPHPPAPRRSVTDKFTDKLLSAKDSFVEQPWAPHAVTGAVGVATTGGLFGLLEATRPEQVASELSTRAPIYLDRNGRPWKERHYVD